MRSLLPPFSLKFCHLSRPRLAFSALEFRFFHKFSSDARLSWLCTFRCPAFCSCSLLLDPSSTSSFFICFWVKCYPNTILNPNIVVFQNSGLTLANTRFHCMNFLLVFLLVFYSTSIKLDRYIPFLSLFCLYDIQSHPIVFMDLVQSQTTIIPPSTCPSIGQHSKVPEEFVLCNASRVIKPLSYPPRQAHISPHPRVPTPLGRPKHWPSPKGP